MVFQAEDRARVRKQQSETAVRLALQGRWDDATHLNTAIIELFPTDVDAHNRLGKALTELGRYRQAKESYKKALEIDPLNSIARKNLSRLATLGDEASPRRATQKISPQMFIEETGKTAVTTLLETNTDIAARMTAGDLVELVPENGSLVVKSTHDEFIGEIEPRLAQRLIKLIEVGNQYVAAISGLRDEEVRVFIRETFQHPSQVGKLSFPPGAVEAFRPYLKERLIRKDAPDDSYYDLDDADDWEGQRGSKEAEVTMRKFGGGSSVDEDEEMVGAEGEG